MNNQRSFLSKKIEKVSYFSRSADDALGCLSGKKVAYFGHCNARARHRVRNEGSRLKESAADGAGTVAPRGAALSGVDRAARHSDPRVAQ